MSKDFYDKTYYGKIIPEKVKISPRKIYENEFYKGLVNPKLGEKLLDLGCGGGLFLVSLEDTGAELWGIDISGNAVDIAKKLVNKPERILCEKADPLPFDNEEFDYVTAWGVVEHLTDTTSMLKEIRRVLKEKGKAFIMVPNTYYYKFVWDTLRKGSGPVRHQEIEYLYSHGEWRNLIEASGFRILKTHKHNKFNKKRFVIWMRNKFIPFYFSNHFIFICKKTAEL